MVKDVAKELDLDRHAIKELEMQYMRIQLAKAGTPGPKADAIDGGISIVGKYLL